MAQTVEDVQQALYRETQLALRNVVVRREETAVIRSQANMAKLLENNPTLMRLRELEILEKIVESGKLQVIVGEKRLTDRVVNLL